MWISKGFYGDVGEVVMTIDDIRPHCGQWDRGGDQGI